MYTSWKFAAYFTAAVILSGCVTPYTDRVAYDDKIRNAPGTITLSDPKLYTRETLISERARDIKWINSLIANSEDSTKIVFRPELVREVEQITSMAAAIGLKFDPAVALTYHREKETGDIQHQMDIMKLQLQLDQLKRDADLVRANLDTQTIPVNNGINKLSDSSASKSTTISTSTTDQLKAAIDKLITTLTSRLDADGKLPKDTPVTSSPFDDFRDRSAYREMLKAAQNSAGLDLLHDYANARLIRLNFQASVFPDSGNLQSLGAIQLHVVPPNPNDVSTKRFLWHWLEYVNTNKNYRADKVLNTQDPTIKALLLSRSFEKVDVLGIEVLLPVIIDGDGRPQSPSNIFRRSGLVTPIENDRLNYQDAISALSSINSQSTTRILSNICANTSTSESDLVDRRIQEASDRELSNEYIQLADTVARSFGNTITLNDVTAKLRNAQSFRGLVLKLMGKYPQCEVYLSHSALQSQWRALADSSIIGNNKVRIYEIGPREQVQQVSTVARSASSLALAASIAASNPGSGVGAEAAASYSRQAMGRATALERVPSVVGYSQAGDSLFGWILGPRAVLNARGHVDMAQLLKTYDLTVDMSVPGWWPTFDLDVTTTWAPSPALIASGKLPADMDNQKRVTIPLLRNSAMSFDSLTQYLVGEETSVDIDSIMGGPINACEKSSLLITGKNIWRAKQVFVLGHLLGEDAITVTADMKGILLTVPAITPLPIGNFSKTLYVITPLEMSKAKDVEYFAEPSGDSCKPKNAQTVEVTKDSVSISELSPLEFVVPSGVQINVTGTNMRKIVAVQLDGQQAKTVQPSPDGKSLVVEFDESNTKSVRESDNTPLKFFEKDKTTGITSTIASVTKYVRTHRKNRGE